MGDTCDDEKACAATVPITTMAEAWSRLDVKALQATMLIPVNCSFNRVTPSADQQQTLRAVARRERTKGTVCVIAYVLRHPACGACREKGKVLSQFVSNDDKLSFFTVVKEVGVVDRALTQYYAEYGGRNPIYQDPEMGIYKAMGGRTVSVWDMARGITKVLWRSRKTKVSPNLGQVTKGDLWTQGGVLIFDQNGKLTHVVYEPTFGKELDMDEIKRAVDKVKRRGA